MVWGAVGCTFRPARVRIDGTLNSARYISNVYDPWLYFLFEPCKILRFSRIMRDRILTVLYEPSLIRKNFQSLPWPARSPDLSPIENVWSIVTERLARHHTPVTAVDQLWHRVEAAWAFVPVHAIQSLTQYSGV
ncbi:transposable element Tcb1 transposase [Trichonephila clavipes]|nr:transposable element Tcb1 transposase [Trichonephila clavipes]